MKRLIAGITGVTGAVFGIRLSCELFGSGNGQYGRYRRLGVFE